METPAKRLEAALAFVAREGILDADPPVALIYDLDAIRARLDDLRDAFPAGTLHAIAAKANPLAAVLRELSERGLGLECASRGELEHARRLGFPPDRIVFDSPAKTDAELDLALTAGVTLNLDSLQELERCAQRHALASSRSLVGLRINPAVGGGAIAATSTATATSKFGVTLDEHHNEITEAFRRSPWLRGLHVHIGSQGCPLGLIAEGVRRVVELADHLEAACGRSIDLLDIGGGLPVDYHTDDVRPGFAEHAECLRRLVPRLFDGRRRLATELGRSVHAKAGWLASRVEATKTAGGRRIAVIHAGADMFVRAAYDPVQWFHRVSVFDPIGRPKGGDLAPWDIAGPLCFTGDVVAHARMLPAIERGDIVVVHDAGAYTLAMWSRYNSRQAPAVWGYDGTPPELRLLKPVEPLDDLLRFWG